LKLYENVVIGNFLYSLGFAICAKSKTIVNPVSINLLQQTPMDKLLGDVLIQGSGTLRLIEFKQVTNKSKKEIYKHENLLRAIKGDDLIKISRSVHWFVETGVQNNKKMMASRVVPYLDAFSSTNAQYDFNEFIQSTASETVDNNSKFSQESLRAYLRIVANMNGNDTSGAGGLVLHLDKSGSIVFCELQDLMQLRLSDREYQQQMTIHYENSKSVDQEFSHSKQKTPDRGLEF